MPVPNEDRQLTETFELAFDGKTFKPCVTNTMKRDR